ncbi:RNA polymerase subunit sigma-70 [Stenotrophomonas maltophilia]|nr:RNA polymerase subunit sigma-70 [Stenotrophomonas maltophilia]MBA0245247.1 sigma-70 family RNA polymerase sigma factor [Stenotrophomonas maltophilia]MBA0248710.1 sigma-70 family RNA polymerase sigma factor [Stenotrophomonas maltophilia]MBA0308463.1 sigma-70 family RNA polymerase sigma factor [Stenotrophomonas maltophilia]MBA0440886.1 sigma-70 family RNA polymerase sigma factor [Stenotrophomonas maltophilia]
MINQLRPELHRYCARLMGSVVEGEDVVQDVLVKAFTLDVTLPDLSALRAWLFRVAHNRAIDLLRSRSGRIAESIDEVGDIENVDDSGPLELLARSDATRVAISRFLDIPIPQRSVIILKDVLGESLVDISTLLGMTVDSVKAHLKRGRIRLRSLSEEFPLSEHPTFRPSESLMRYVDLFNGGDWDGLRAMLADDVLMKQSSHPVRKGASDVGKFFGAYSAIPGIYLVPAMLEGREVLAVYVDRNDRVPSYIMWLGWDGDRVSFIRDYRYVDYIMEDVSLVLFDGRN